jgi:hypothetical protein
MPDEAFEKISIPQSEFNTRIKRLNSREALIDNKLYDIVRERNLKNSTIFFCLFDHEEHSLLVKIRKATQQNSSIPFGNAIKLIDLVIKSALLDTKDIIFHHFSTILKFGNLIIRYQLPIIHIFIPPPEMVSLG